MISVNTVQHRQDLFGRFKFDAAGRYSLNFGVQSGRRFTTGWNETGVGFRRGNLNLYLKHLYLSAQPIKGLELQYGGFDFLRGAATEITTYNNDGFLTGQRVILRRPRELFFDEIAYTAGFFGDLTTPNLNRRYHRLKQINYHQFIVSKKLGERAQASADYTFAGGADILRQAVKVNTTELRVVDSLRLELYERLDGARTMSMVALFAALFERGVTSLELERTPATLANGPSYPNVLRFFDLPQLVALTFPRTVTLRGADPADWEWSLKTAKLLGGTMTVSHDKTSPH